MSGVSEIVRVAVGEAAQVLADGFTVALPRFATGMGKSCRIHSRPERRDFLLVERWSSSPLCTPRSDWSSSSSATPLIATPAGQELMVSLSVTAAAVFLWFGVGLTLLKIVGRGDVAASLGTAAKDHVPTPAVQPLSHLVG